MVYLDTSAIVALLLPESASEAVAGWYASTKSDLVSAAWCVTEFASALSNKQRAGQINGAQSTQAWEHFSRLMANDVQLLPVEPGVFHRAALMTMDAGNSLRAGDALHLACAEHAGAKTMATLDTVLGRYAQRLKFKVITFT